MAIHKYVIDSGMQVAHLEPAAFVRLSMKRNLGVEVIVLQEGLHRDSSDGLASGVHHDPGETSDAHRSQAQHQRSFFSGL